MGKEVHGMILFIQYFNEREYEEIENVMSVEIRYTEEWGFILEVFEEHYVCLKVIPLKDIAQCVLQETVNDLIHFEYKNELGYADFK